MLYFTSDTHFGHHNIIKYCRRPFSNVTEMDEALIANWNDMIEANDDVYHLGDVAFGGAKQTIKYLERLNGRIHLIEGNHDRRYRKELEKAGCLRWVKPLHEITHNEQKIVMCHYSMRVWNGSHRGAWQLFGHSHGTIEVPGLSCDVGVDSWLYAPVSFEMLESFMEKRYIEIVDQHDTPR